MVQSLDRGLRILEILSDNGEMSITELAEILKVDKSTVSRLMETLRYHDFVQVSRSTKKYKLGFRVLNLSNSLEKSLNIRDIARPIIKSVAEELEQSIHLCAFNNTMAYVIDQVERGGPHSISATVGMIEPMHASSVGKCIMAYRREELQLQMMENIEFIKYTNNTIQTPEALLEELKIIKQQGYAVDNEEVSEGVRCVAVPIFNFGNMVRYSIGISGSVTMMTEEKVKKFVERLSRAAKKISRELGHQST